MSNYSFKIYNHLTILTLVLLSGLGSCTKDDIITSAEKKLNFSEPEISFDTIFTQTGSITRNIKIYNPHSNDISIESIRLLHADSSEFLLNVNGVSSSTFSNIHIAADDSIYIFLQALLDENTVDTLVGTTDSLIISYNTNVDFIPITVSGQDVIYCGSETSGSITLSSAKPYIIKDSLVINQGDTLTIEAGVRVYLHKYANLIINGTLLINGTHDKPVTFSSNRIEQAFEMLPGQWGSIIFSKTSTNNTINYAIIQNGVNGLLIYGTEESQVSLSLHNTIIRRMSSNVIFAQNASIESSNCVLAQANNYIMALQGGTYSFKHITIVNTGTISGRNYVPSVNISNYNLSTESSLLLESFSCANSIIVGKMKNEIEISSLNEESLPVSFSNCLVKQDITGDLAEYFTESFEYDATENLFRNIHEDIFTLDTLSQAQDTGNIEIATDVPLDIREQSRIEDGKPDLGAYEFFSNE
ncbi:MAG: hypothetical protein PF481_08500 [Bacteroidales bacterium]|jgi:hypothetical protein|nr:hypothetical protein [Bacteroidales bacterium]